MGKAIDPIAEYDKITALHDRWIGADGKLSLEAWKIKFETALENVSDILQCTNASPERFENTALKVGTCLRKGTPAYFAKKEENKRIREELAHTKTELEMLKKAYIELDVEKLIYEEGWKASRQSVLDIRARSQAEIGALREGWAMNFKDLQSSLDTHVGLESGHVAIIKRQYRLLGITPVSKHLRPTIARCSTPAAAEPRSVTLPQQTSYNLPSAPPVQALQEFTSEVGNSRQVNESLLGAVSRAADRGIRYDPRRQVGKASVCTICGTLCASKTLLNRHLRWKHNMSLADLRKQMRQ